jgi:hypothetical protein
MKRERIVKADGRYLLFYSFHPEEIVRPGSSKKPQGRRRRSGGRRGKVR